MRFREDKPGDLDRARAAVRAWRERNPEGTEDEMLAATGRGFRAGYAPVLRCILFTADRKRAHEVTGAGHE